MENTVLTNRPIMQNLEAWFSPFRSQILGIDQEFETPYGRKKIVYADWTASGRLYRPIEEIMMHEVAPFVGNTHTETTVTGSSMTHAYHEARHIIKAHVRAHESDVLIASQSGMTGVVNKFQRILGLKIHERFQHRLQLSEQERPVIFITHMEHHSNQTSWIETIAEVVVVEPDADGLVDLNAFENAVRKYASRELKIAAVTSCSNVTGVATPYHEIAALMHRYGGLCFVDFACAAPYIDICMRPEESEKHLDAIYFSPHKFLGGPGSSGVLIFDPRLYKLQVPDSPGGGTVDWTNPWGEHKYIDGIEAREDGGTPAFLQTMRVAMAIQLKNQMGTKEIHQREATLMARLWPCFDRIQNLHVLADHLRERQAVVSFYVDGLHYNLGVKLLNDRFGIQVRGGCSCAGTYGHYLLHVSRQDSKSITDKINHGDLSSKPGWIRLSIHPTTTDSEMDYILEAVESLCANFREWGKDYEYNLHTNEFIHKSELPEIHHRVDSWFDGVRIRG
jgi:selenocysteine lyase/cysteine desulfurase